MESSLTLSAAQAAFAKREGEVWLAAKEVDFNSDACNCMLRGINMLAESFGEVAADHGDAA